MDILIKLLILQQATTVLLQANNNTTTNDLSGRASKNLSEKEVVDFRAIDEKTANESNFRVKRQLVGIHVQDPRRRYKNRGNPIHRSHGGYEIKEIHNPHIVGYGYVPEVVIPHKEGGYEIHDPHGGGSGHDEHGGGGGGYGHDAHGGGGGGGYGHDAHGGDGGGYGQIDHGYKEPPKYIKAAPYYGPQYSPYDLIAPDKSKKNKKTKYGDDPLYEKGHYKDGPTSHFGGFGGGGSIGYKAKGGYKGSGGGHKGGGGYKGSGGHKGGGGGHKGSGGHKGGGGGGYKGSEEHKGGGGGYKGSEEHKGGGGDYKGSNEHKGGGGGYGKSQSGYSSHSVKVEHHQPSPEHVSIPYNTYDPHADARKVHEVSLPVSNNGYVAQHPQDTGLNLNLNLRGANADVSDMLLYDPYALTDTKLEKVADIQLPNKILSLKSL